MTTHDGYTHLRSYHTEWQISRLNTIIKYIGKEFFNQKSLFEVGCIFAYYSNEIYKWGGKVTCSDIRESHLNVVKESFPYIQTRKDDFDKNCVNMPKFDIIIHFGLLYHLENPEKHLNDISQYCDYLILETECCDADFDHMLYWHEEGADQAFNHKGTRPSRTLVEKWLKQNNFNFLLIKDPITNGGGHIYDWNETNSCVQKPSHRRFWICWKPTVNCPIKSDLISLKT